MMSGVRGPVLYFISRWEIVIRNGWIGNRKSDERKNLYKALSQLSRVVREFALPLLKFAKGDVHLGIARNLARGIRRFDWSAGVLEM